MNEPKVGIVSADTEQEAETVRLRLLDLGVYSCWGFYGLEYCKEEARLNVPKEPSCQSDSMELEETLA